MGAAILGLSQAKPPLIVKVDRIVSSRPQRHAGENKVWRLIVDHDEARRWLETHPELADQDDEATPEHPARCRRRRPRHHFKPYCSDQPSASLVGAKSGGDFSSSRPHPCNRENVSVIFTAPATSPG